MNKKINRIAENIVERQSKISEKDSEEIVQSSKALTDEIKRSIQSLKVEDIVKS